MEIYFSYLYYYENEFEQFNSRRTLTDRQTYRLGDREEIHHGGPSKGNRLLSTEIYLVHCSRNRVCGGVCVQIRILIF